MTDNKVIAIFIITLGLTIGTCITISYTAEFLTIHTMAQKGYVPQFSSQGKIIDFKKE